MNHPFPLASPLSWTWLSLLKSRSLGTELFKAAALESVLLTTGSELRELGVVVNPWLFDSWVENQINVVGWNGNSINGLRRCRMKSSKYYLVKARPGKRKASHQASNALRKHARKRASVVVQRSEESCPFFGFKKEESGVSSKKEKASEPADIIDYLSLQASHKGFSKTWCEGAHFPLPLPWKINSLPLIDQGLTLTPYDDGICPPTRGLTRVFLILLVKASARLRLTKEALWNCTSTFDRNTDEIRKAIIGANDAIASVRAKPKERRSWLVSHPPSTNMEYELEDLCN